MGSSEVAQFEDMSSSYMSIFDQDDSAEPIMSPTGLAAVARQLCDNNLMLDMAAEDQRYPHLDLMQHHHHHQYDSTMMTQHHAPLQQPFKCERNLLQEIDFEQEQLLHHNKRIRSHD